VYPCWNGDIAICRGINPSAWSEDPTRIEKVVHWSCRCYEIIKFTVKKGNAFK
jgi:hypothetical protein